MPFAQQPYEKLGLKLWYYGKDLWIYYLISANPTAREIVDGSLNAKDGRMTRAFLEDLAENEKMLCLKGRSKQIGQNLYRLKTTGQLRFMYFRDGSALIITHAFIKKTNPIDREEIKKAKRLKDEFYERKKELGL